MMSSLFSEAGRRRLREVTKGRLLCAFDFDGTLAPIVSAPHEAALPDEIHAQLVTLRALAPIAIITGRAVADLRQRLGFTPDYVVGNHGLEGVPGQEDLARQHESICDAWREQLLAAFLDERYAGMQLEDKRYSLAVHYRHARDADRAAQHLTQLLHDIVPHPRIIEGKYVFNLLTEDASNKGSALDRLIAVSGARHAIYVGDDVTDEDVFRLRRPDVLAVRVEHSRDSAADFYLPRAEDIVRLLDLLIVHLRAHDARNWMLGPSESIGTAA